MKNAIVGGLITIILAGAAWAFLNKDPDNPPEFGKLSGVNEIALATYQYSDQCEHTDDEGFGKGITLYSWKFKFGYGVKIPANWKWSVKGLETGVYHITLPDLSQLYPHKVEATEEIRNPANAERSQRMREVAVESGKERMAAAEVAALANDPNILKTARKAAVAFFTPILSSFNPDVPFKSVAISFGNENAHNGAQFIKRKTCL